MTFGANLAIGMAEGAATGALDAALWGQDVVEGVLWGAASGALFATLTSENLANAIKGKGFKTNTNVFNDFKAGKYAVEGSTWQQDALDYFDMEGTYKPDVKSLTSPDSDYWGCTNIRFRV